jgi:diacylglycerol kinase (ATP)
VQSPHKRSNPFFAARVAWAGLVSAARHEFAFRLELAACVLLVPAAFWLGDTAVERSLLLGSLLLVLIVELGNSALETALDRVSLEHHPLTGRAKDIGAAAVLLSLVNAAVIWLLLAMGSEH